VGWQPDNIMIAKTPILFVQLQFDSPFDSPSLKISEELERAIDEDLREKNLGKLFTSDLVGNNYTMLFVISDYPQGVEIIQKAIENKKVKQNIVIARRIYRSPFKWKYKILHPKQTSLQFHELK